MKLTLFLLLILFFAGCNHKEENNFHKYLNQGNIEKQVFTVNTLKDTTLVTTAGILIKIAAGSLESKTNPVKIEIKEALDIATMIKGGLQTLTDKNEILSSAGMFYINVSDPKDVIIKKKLEILVPTTIYNPDMKIWKGAFNNKNEMKWTEPINLPEDSTGIMITQGEILYKSNCANCHMMKSEFTGPPLHGITYRRSKKWLYDFTRNSAEIIANSLSGASIDHYANCIFDRYKPVVMSSFPTLTDKDLDNIYAFIKAETDKQPMPGNVYTKTCCDSCDLFGKELFNFYGNQNDKNDLLNGQEERFNLDRSILLGYSSQLDSSNKENYQKINNGFVVPEIKTATWYTVNVDVFGWVNLDILLDKFEDCKPSELIVNLKGNYDLDFNVSLIIPDYKVFVEGTKSDDDDSYFFDETNGMLLLPQKALCTIIAFAEYEGKILFGKETFTSKAQQTISVTFKSITKEEMLKIIKDIDTNKQTEIKADGVKPDAKNIKTNKALDSKYQLLPKNCNCSGLSAPATTTPL